MLLKPTDISEKVCARFWYSLLFVMKTGEVVKCHLVKVSVTVQVDKRLVHTAKPGLATLSVLRLSGEDGPKWVRCEASVSGVYHLSSASIPVLEKHPPPPGTLQPTTFKLGKL